MGLLSRHAVRLCGIALAMGMAATASAGAVHAATGPVRPSVIGGSDATIEQYPFMVAIRKPHFFCGGSLAAPTKVITAAHCVYGQDPASLTVYGGRTHQDDPTDPGVSSAIAGVWIHPQYGHTVNPDEDDIAVITLTTPFPFETLGLPEADDATLYRQLYQPGHVGTVVGWGSTDPNNSVHDNQLHQVQVPVVDGATCQAWYGDKYAPEAVDPNTMVCAGVPQGGIGPCYGDSGGPLIIDGWLAGVVSWGGLKCADVHEPGVYVKVTTFESDLLAQINS